MKNYDADLSAYLVLSDMAKNEEDKGVLEDISSKMRVHVNKLKGGTSGISIKW